MELEYWPSTVYMPQSLAEVASIMRGLCETLARLHGAGFLHKDIKLANMLASTTDTNEVVVKLIDFEFAYRYGDDDVDTPCYTSGYMPPECQCLDWDGIREVVKNTPRGASDMFAAGIVMLALLVGDDVGATSQRDTKEVIALLETVMTDMSKYKTHRQRLARFVKRLCSLGYGGCEEGPLVQDKGDALDLLHKLTCRSVDARLTAVQALAHPFLSPTATP